MGRDGLTAAQITALRDGHVRPVRFVAIFFDSGTSYISSDVRPITWGGNEYQGVGDYGSIEPIKETSELQASNISMRLSGIASEYIEEALAADYQDRNVKIWLGLLDDNYQLIGTPVLEFEGHINQMNFEKGEESAIILTATGKLYLWEIPNGSQFTDADQQTKFPGDKGLAFVNEVARSKIPWGPQ